MFLGYRRDLADERARFGSFATARGAERAPSKERSSLGGLRPGGDRLDPADERREALGPLATAKDAEGASQYQAFDRVWLWRRSPRSGRRAPRGSVRSNRKGAEGAK